MVRTKYFRYGNGRVSRESLVYMCVAVLEKSEVWISRFFDEVFDCLYAFLCFPISLKLSRKTGWALEAVFSSESSALLASITRSII